MFEETNESIQLIICAFNIRLNIAYQLRRNARNGNFVVEIRSYDYLISFDSHKISSKYNFSTDVLITV